MARKVPSFTGFKPASAASSQVKRSNRRRDTKHEVLLRRELWRLGLRFRKNVETLPGKPDIVFSGVRVVVFCDGDFWHGRKWQTLKSKLEQGTNATYWSAKIASNIERDIRNTSRLQEAGWHVIRLWETDILRDPEAAAALIKSAVDARRHKNKALTS
ncbi:MAG: very short patch repair endonuclease [Blastocatellia bacterium]